MTAGLAVSDSWTEPEGRRIALNFFCSEAAAHEFGGSNEGERGGIDRREPHHGGGSQCRLVRVCMSRSAECPTCSSATSGTGRRTGCVGVQCAESDVRAIFMQGDDRGLSAGNSGHQWEEGGQGEEGLRLAPTDMIHDECDPFVAFDAISQ